jgi:Calcineurin-like phosphoesterase
MSETLIRKLFDGPIDIVGDIHGEIDALRMLRRRLGYDERGVHPEGRRLVFVGDLGDRGPDSPDVVDWVRELVSAGRAQCVLGNHDFNALWASRGGPMKSELSWLFDEAEPFHYRGRHIRQVLVRGRRRDEVLAFFATLPVALERGGDLPVRIVHACWDTASLDRIRHETDVIDLHIRERDRIEQTIRSCNIVDPLERKLRRQNDNAVKRLTSGTEGRSQEPIFINNEPRYEKRVPWWPDYRDQPLCIFGHYWRTPLPGEGAEYHLFDGVPRNALVGGGAMCIDYSVGKRFKERVLPSFDGTYRTSLAALRLPEGVLYFDNAEPMRLLRPDGRPAFEGAA